jgi:O-antigen/teichoic acid export membrane protein
MGIYQLALAVFAMAGTVSQLGMNSGLLRFVPIFRARGDRARMVGAVRLSVTVALLTSGALGLGLFLLAEPVARGVFDEPGFAPVARAVAVAVPFFAATNVLLAATQALGKMQYRALVSNMIEPLSRFVVAALLFLVGWRLWGAVGALVAASVVAASVAGIYQRRLYRARWREATIPPEWASILMFSVPQTLSRFLVMMIFWTDVLMLGVLGSSEDVGLYGIASRTALLALIFQEAFGSMFGPLISGYFESREHGKLLSAFRSVTKWSFTFALPVMIVFLAIPGDVLAVFRPEYRAAAGCLALLGVTHLVYTACGPTGRLLLMSGRPWLSLANNLAVGVLNALWNWLLIPRYGILGAAIATSISVLLLTGARLLQVGWLLSLHPFRLASLKPLAAGAPAALAAWQLGLLLEGLPVLVVVVAVTTALLLVYALLLLWMGFDQEDRLVLSRIRARLAGALG